MSAKQTIDELRNRLREIGEKLGPLLQEAKALKVEKEQLLYELSQLKVPRIKVSDQEIRSLQETLKSLEDQVQTRVLRPDEERRIYEKIKEVEKRLSVLTSAKKLQDQDRSIRSRLDEIRRRQRELHEQIEPLIQERERVRSELQKQIILEKLRKYKEMEKERGYSINLRFERVNRNEIKEAIRKKRERGELVTLEELKVLYDEKQ